MGCGIDSCPLVQANFGSRTDIRLQSRSIVWVDWSARRAAVFQISVEGVGKL